MRCIVAVIMLLMGVALATLSGVVMSPNSRAYDTFEMPNMEYTYTYLDHNTTVYRATRADIDDDGTLEYILVGKVGGLGSRPWGLLTVWNYSETDGWHKEYEAVFVNSTFLGVTVGDVISDNGYQEVIVVGSNDTESDTRGVILIGNWNGTNFNYSIFYYTPATMLDIVFTTVKLYDVDLDGKDEIVSAGVAFYWVSGLKKGIVIASFEYSAGSLVNDRYVEYKFYALDGYRDISVYGMTIDYIDQNASDVEIAVTGPTMFGPVYAGYVGVFVANGSVFSLKNETYWLSGIFAYSLDLTMVRYEGKRYLGVCGTTNGMGEIRILNGTTLNPVVIRIWDSGPAFTAMKYVDVDSDGRKEMVFAAMAEKRIGTAIWSHDLEMESNLIETLDNATLEPATLVASVNNSVIGVFVTVNASTNATTFRVAKFFLFRNIDANKPFVEITSPEDGSTVSGRFTVSINASDYDSGIGYVLVYLNDSLIQNLATPPYRLKIDTHNISAGIYNITVVAFDRVGNENNDTIFVNVSDIYPPKITIHSPLNDEVVQDRLFYNISISDNTNISRVELLIDDNTMEVISNVTSHMNLTGTIEMDQFSNGSHVFKVRSTDVFGIQSERVIPFYVNDTIPPVFNTSLENGTTYSGNISIQIIASDGTGIALQQMIVNGTWSTFSGDTIIWDTTSLAEGTYNVTFRLQDPLGNTATRTYIVYVKDITGPSLELLSPSSGSTYQGTVTLSVSAADPSGTAKIEIYVDNVLVARINGSSGSAQLDTRAFDDGRHELKLVATDIYGNVREVTQTIEISNGIVARATYVMLVENPWLTVLLIGMVGVIASLVYVQKRRAAINSSLDSLNILMMIHKGTGVPIFTAYFRGIAQDPQLVGGLLTALSNFTAELSGAPSAIKQFEGEKIVITAEKGDYVFAVLISEIKPHKAVVKMMSRALHEFEAKYADALQSWTGNVEIFSDFIETVRKIFGRGLSQDEYERQQIYSRLLDIQSKMKLLEREFNAGMLSEQEYYNKLMELKKEMDSIKEKMGIN